MSQGNIVSKLQRTFAYHLSRWFPSEFLKWVDRISRSFDLGLLNSTLSFGDFAAGGAIGTAPNTVDIANTFFVAQTTGGQTLSLPNPTNINLVRVVYVVNTGNQSFTIFGSAVAAGKTAAAVWWPGGSYNRIV
jgi:hypothetical protein